MHHIVITFIANDKPGLVEQLSKLVFQANGSWLESRMSQLAGKFAGIARISVPTENRESLEKQLKALSSQGISISLEDCEEKHANRKNLAISIIGQDRPGIVQELGSALSLLQINIEELKTDLSIAAMSAEPLFNAEVKVSMPAIIKVHQLQEKLDDISNKLNVDISVQQD